MRRAFSRADARVSKLRNLIEEGVFVRALEAHNGLSAWISETARSRTGDQFDALWVSSFTNSLSRGQPDEERLDLLSKFSILNDIVRHTTKPILFDGDTGGSPNSLRELIPILERYGVSGVAIEDKTGQKRNSFAPPIYPQALASVPAFCEKISIAHATRKFPSFLVIARTESLIVSGNMNDAIHRACDYVEAGADGIFIHSKSENFDEIRAFCLRFRSINKRTPLVVSPTTYSSVYECELRRAGVNVVIYANQLLRAAYKSMQAAAQGILDDGRAAETEDICAPMTELLSLPF
jgi:phosphoenolpyruvate mutase